MAHMVPRRSLAVLLAGVAAVIGVAPASADAAKTKSTKKKAAPSARLSAFGDCAALLAYARAGARSHPGAVPVRFPAAARPEAGGTPGFAQPVPAAAPTMDSATTTPAAEEFSTTNVQEAGIDEPDLVKTDGRRIYAIAQGSLHVLVVREGRPVHVGALRLDGFGHELLLHDKRLLVLGTRFLADEQPQPAGPTQPAPAPSPDQPVASPTPGRAAPRLSIAPDPGRQQAVLLDVDVSDAARPRVTREVAMDGRYLSARATGDTARVVVTTPPRPVDLPTPAPGSDAEATRRAAVTKAALATYRPTITDRRGSTTRTRGAVPCRQVRRPRLFSGLDTTTVLTIDLDKGLPEVEADAVLGGADTVYASATGLFLATQRWDAQLDETGVPSRSTTTTHIHRFRTGGADRTTYAASGAVPGYILNQFALSEHGGFLRVATTSQPLSNGTDRTPSSSSVIVLDERDGRLVPVGRVGDLGIDERIYAVRFIGDVGYVVTFRQVDPLYTIDLADPRAPKVLGELKILGYSAYLHPVGDDLLLGVGQDATERGQRLGTQLSLFDVSDLRAPRVLRQARVGGSSSSSVEYDHRAFLWWAPRRMAVLPVSIFGDGGVTGRALRQDVAPAPAPAPPPGVAPSPARPPQGFVGAIGFRVTRADPIRELGRITDPATNGFTSQILRTLVVGSRLVTVSEQGVGTASLDDLTRTGFAAFPAGAR
jgi:hypothetical protein